ncbi:zinc ribbon domain-containing protein [Pseudomonas asuensis]
MLKHKCAHAGVVFKEIDEGYSTRTCSACGTLRGPKGVNGPRIRKWVCSECGVAHDRDISAAKNICALGQEFCQRNTYPFRGEGYHQTYNNKPHDSPLPLIFSP